MSMASPQAADPLIAMAGDEIIMPKDAQTNDPQPWTIAAGNAEDFRKLADEMDKANTSIQETYLTHFTDTREKLVNCWQPNLG